MSSTIFIDNKQSPTAFMWYGAPDQEHLIHSITERHLNVPADLFDLWRTFGGGIMFETEEVLTPLGRPEYALDFDETNATHHRAGLASAMFIFHQGVWLSAVRSSSPYYVTVDPITYAVTNEFESLDHWYTSTVRSEFAERYGLARLC